MLTKSEFRVIHFITSNVTSQAYFVTIRTLIHRLYYAICVYRSHYYSFKDNFDILFSLGILSITLE